MPVVEILEKFKIIYQGHECFLGQRFRRNDAFAGHKRLRSFKSRRGPWFAVLLWTGHLVLYSTLLLCDVGSLPWQGRRGGERVAAASPTKAHVRPRCRALSHKWSGCSKSCSSVGYDKLYNHGGSLLISQLNFCICEPGIIPANSKS